MGTYNYDWKMLVEELKECLDGIEGDFSRKSLMKALGFMYDYQPTTDGNKKLDKFWISKFKEIEDE